MEEFLVAHEPQLKSINFPVSLSNDLYEILHKDSRKDLIKSAFELRTFENSRPMLIAKKDFNINDSLYVVDHIWTNDGGKQAYEKLKKCPQLVEDLAVLFNIPQPIEAGPSFDLRKQIDVISSLCESTKYDAENALIDCDSDTIFAMVKLLNAEEKDFEKEPETKKKKKCTFDEFKVAFEAGGDSTGNENEAYLQKMYENFLLEGDGFGNTLQYNWSDDGSTITVFVSIPGTARKQSVKSTLCTKTWKLVVNDIELINGDLHASVKPDECVWAIESPGVLCMTLEKVCCGNIWPELIKGEVLLTQDVIFSTSWLKQRSASIYLREILDAMWSYNQMYAIMSPGGVKKKPVWYIMDKYGSALTHGIDPNFQCSPFFNIHTGQPYSLLWPIKNITKGCLCSRNFIPQIMQNGTHETYKARLKAFTGNNIHEDEDVGIEAPIDNKKKVDQKVQVFNVKMEDKIVTDEPIMEKSLFLSIYNSNVSKDMSFKLKFNVTTNNDGNADVSILVLNDTSIMIEGDALPTIEMIANKNYLQNYISFQLNDCSWLAMSYFLPRDLSKFCEEFEKCNLPRFWIVKQVDKRLLDVPIAVSSSYSRIVRMCEAGPISVSKYIANQPRFRHRRFVLNYSTILNIADNSIFIYKEPLIRQTKEEYNPNALIDEYDTITEITESPNRLVGNQDAETYSDFKIGMNKLLLPTYPDMGWDVYQNTLFQCIGVLAKTFLKDLVVKKQGACFVIFGVDLIIDWNLAPIIIDVNGVGNLPNKNSLQAILELTIGNFGNDFVKVM